MTWTGQKSPIRAKDYEVREIPSATARRLVEAEHYAGAGSNTRIATHGLFRIGEHWDDLALGAAWWLAPTRGAAEALAGEEWRGVLALSRLVISPEVGGNGATILMSRSIRAIDRARWPYLVTYADTWRGHTGGIYKATGWQDDGLTAPQPVWTLRGRMISRKAGPRSRTVEELRAMGAVCVGSFPKRRFVMRPALTPTK